MLTKIAPLRESLSISENEKTSALTFLSNQEELVRLTRSEIESLENTMASLRLQRSEKQNELHTAEEEIAVLAERKRGLNENIMSLEKRKVDLAVKNEQLSSQIEELKLSIAQTGDEEKSLSTSLASEQEGFKNFEQQLFAAREKSNVSHESLIKVLNDLALKQNDRERAHARFERVQSHCDELGIRKTQLDSERSELQSRSEISKAEKEKYALEIEEEKNKLSDLERHREELFSESEREKSEAQQLRDTLQSTEARMDFLNGLVENLEGLPDGAKALARGEIEGLPKFEILSDIFYVDPEYRIAAESVLGDASNFLVAPDEHTALSAVEALRNRDLGKVTFVCLDKIKPPDAHLNSASFRRFSDQIQMTRENEAIGKYFFENVALVENFSEAEKLLHEDSNLLCVNFSGDLFSAKGIIRGGSTRRTEGGRVGKLRQLEELRDEKVKLTSRLSELDGTIGRLQSEVASSRSKPVMKSSKMSTAIGAGGTVES